MSTFQEKNSSLEHMEADNPLAGPVELRCLGFSKKWNKNSNLHPFTQAAKQQQYSKARAAVLQQRVPVCSIHVPVMRKEQSLVRGPHDLSPKI